MAEKVDYVIVGGGLAGASAISGIREIDKEGTILMIGNEILPPYHRPPLTKDLWYGKKEIDDVFVQPMSYYEDLHVVMRLGRKVVALDTARKLIREDTGDEFRFDKLLLATGGIPRKLDIPGGDDPDICYYRYLKDFERIFRLAQTTERVLVIGGGFTGSEIAAALALEGLSVAMLFPEQHICKRLFPPSLGMKINKKFIAQRVTLVEDDLPASITKNGNAFVTSTRNGALIESDFIVASIGIEPAVVLAEEGGLLFDNGIHVNERLATSHPDIFAAGDNANIFYNALDGRFRFEHWDAAISQGRCAGKNMAGENALYTELPYFYSDLFDFSYEAVGDTDPNQDIEMIWKEKNKTGVVCYMRDGCLRGAMMVNVWDKVDTARRIITAKKTVSVKQLQDDFELT